MTRMGEFFRPGRRTDTIILGGTAAIALTLAGIGYWDHEQSRPLITSCVSAWLNDSDSASLNTVVEVRQPSLRQASKSQLAASAMNFINTGGCARQGDEIYNKIVTSSPTNADCIEAPDAPAFPKNSTLYLCRAAITTALAEPVTPGTGQPSPTTGHD